MKTVHMGMIVLFLILLAALAVLFLPSLSSPPVPLQPVVIATGSGEYSALTQIADEKGYFKRYGLNVTIIDYPTGVVAMNELLAGNADLAYAAEFVGVSTSFRPADFRIITSTAKSDVIALIFRNDRGISKPSDLKGKTIAFPKGTAAEFFLGRYLTLNGMDIKDVTVRYLSPAELEGSIESGDSDAVVIWEPNAYQITQKLGRNGTKWPVQGGQRFYWVTYTRADVIRDKPAMIRQYLYALKDAETFMYANGPEAKAIVQKRMNLTDDHIKDMWGQHQFALSLDQGLILTMEDEARWMAGQNLTGGQVPPSYLDMLYQDGMREVKPSAVTIIR
jgi:ABC-type nitrate/sulfonate/bicarbonate transport system substrate-binding protein